MTIDDLFRQTEKDNETSYLERQLRMTLEELARLQNALADAKMKLTAIQNKSTDEQVTAMNNSVENSSLQIKEIMSQVKMIKDYTGFLLNESVGNIGVIQRKFLYRIRHSIELIEETLTTHLEEKSSR